MPVVAMIDRNNRVSWTRLMFLIANGRDMQAMECMLAVWEELKFQNSRPTLETAIPTFGRDLLMILPRRLRGVNFLMGALIVVAGRCVASTFLFPLERRDWIPWVQRTSRAYCRMAVTKDSVVAPYPGDNVDDSMD